jgi:DNA-binding transcriptional MerR regulator
MDRLKIGDVARQLGVKKFVIRTWEKEFDFFFGGKGIPRVFYTHKHVKKFSEIKELIIDRGFTVENAKRFLKGDWTLESIVESTEPKVETHTETKIEETPEQQGAGFIEPIELTELETKEPDTEKKPEIKCTPAFTLEEAISCEPILKTSEASLKESEQEALQESQALEIQAQEELIPQTYRPETITAPEIIALEELTSEQAEQALSTQDILPAYLPPIEKQEQETEQDSLKYFMEKLETFKVQLEQFRQMLG